MGVVNVTPDSFSDGGQFLDTDAAIAHGRKLLDDGADILDIGGESTRPGAAPTSPDEERARVLPVIEALAGETGAVLSIDTRNASVARAAIDTGATIWNDVSALMHDAEGVETAAALGCDVVLMHAQGDPETMQTAPAYDDVVAEVMAFLAARIELCVAVGIAREKITVDPGIGFGKTLAHNLALLNGLDKFQALGCPVLLGASRKRFIQGVDKRAVDAGERLGGSLAAVLAGAARGVSIVRVHDVAETRQALLVAGAIENPNF
ncbi:MAG: dihydropteroate synthase [Pseudomonadota bacterium]